MQGISLENRDETLPYLNEDFRAHPFQKDPYSPGAIEERFERLKSRVECFRKEMISYLDVANWDVLTLLVMQLGYLRKVIGAHPINFRFASIYFEYLANGCSDFEDKLDEFRETPEGNNIKDHIDSFAKDLNYRASSLKELVSIYMDPNHPMKRFEIDNISRYIDGLSGEMGNDLDKLASAFRQFNTHGIPSMQYEEQREADILMSISTVGALLAAVTATTLQISLGSDKSLLTSIVNSFWFSSLVFSIGAALNSFLSVIWKRTPYGSRGRSLPLWLTVWIQISAPLFLTISIGSFSAGLVLFTFADNDLPSYTRYITLATTAITSFGSVVIIAWFAYERWKSSHLPWKPFPGKISHRLRSWANTNSIAPVVSSVAQSAVTWPTMSRVVSPNPVTIQVVPPQSPDKSSDDVEAQRKGLPRIARAAGVINVLRKFRPGRRPTPGSSLVPQNITVHAPYLSPLRMIYPEYPSKFLRLRRAVQDIEYSPNAELLATTSYDEKTKSSTTVIYVIEVTITAILGPPPVTGCSSALTELSTFLIKAANWPQPFKGIVQFNLHYGSAPVRHIHSAPGVNDLISTDLLLIEENSIIEMTVNGRELTCHNFNTLLLRDVAVVPNNPLLLITGRVIEPSKDFMPINSRGEKRLVLYDVVTKQVMRHVPFLDDIRYVRISRFPLSDGLDVLLSLKDRPSSMLWSLKLQPELRLESIQTQTKPSEPQLRELMGHAYFVGDQDQMIACRDTDGAIHLWDRTSGLLVRSIDARTSGQGLRSFAWRPTSTPSVTFASTHHKELRIWTTELRTIEEEKEVLNANEGGSQALPSLELTVKPSRTTVD